MIRPSYKYATGTWRKRLFAGSAALLAGLATLTVAPASSVDAAPQQASSGPLTGSVNFFGRGWGHGRGMGQYGALGYATEHGWNSSQILDHYYGGTTGGPAPSGGAVNPNLVRVDLRYMHNRPTVVGITNGTVILRRTIDGVEIARVQNAVARLVARDGGFDVQTGPSCDGPWTSHARGDSAPVVTAVAESSAGGSDGALFVCGPNARTWYEGRIRALTHSGEARTVNVVNVEQYIRGVVPNEVPASWHPAALEAQAVAARSYVMAGDSRHGIHADTCETILCQVYDGIYTERGGSFRSSTHPNTDAAIAATEGLVRLRSNGSVARTEFSSSTGGYTVDADFPAVPDLGDSVAANPNHTWQQAVPVSTIEGHYNRGRLLSIEVIERDGNGPDGGRVKGVELEFERATVRETGSRLRSLLRLKSDWFTPGGSGSAETFPEADAYVNWVYNRFLGRDASPAERSRWRSVVADGDREQVSAALAFTDGFAGNKIDELYRVALGRPSDPNGRAYWLSTITDGARLESVGVWFYSSDEYHQRSGGTSEAFVRALYRDLLGRGADAKGLAYWATRIDEHGAGRDDVAAGFYASPESRITRSRRIYSQAVGLAPTSAQLNTMAERLLEIDDLALAAEMAASAQAYSVSQAKQG